MLVRVKRGLGNYGHVQNGFVQPKNYASGAFEVSDEKGQELIKRGIVDEVEGETAPASTIAETPEPEAAAPAAKTASKKAAKAPKKKAETAEEPADDAPTFDATSGIA